MSDRLDADQAMLDLAAAQACLRSAAPPPGEEPVPVADLAGRILAHAVYAAGPLPPFRNSALDGYALRAADAAGRLPVVARIAAGQDPAPLPAGAAAAIATGAVVPDGADAVVAIERAEEVAGEVSATGPVRPGDGVRLAGADLAAGAEVVPAGVRLTPLAASAVAAAGHGEAICFRRPRAVILATGDELVPPGRPLLRGQIHDSNTTLLAASLWAYGCDVVVAPRVADEPDATLAAYRSALPGADLVVSTGGVSVGPRDQVKSALTALGVDELFWRVAIQPGKPVFAGRAATGAIVIGLPGNPLSALAGLELLVRPLVAAVAGDRVPTTVTRRLGRPVERLAHRLRALPARVDDDVVEPLGADQSHQVARAASARALVLIPAGDEPASAGTAVEVALLV